MKGHCWYISCSSSSFPSSASFCEHTTHRTLYQDDCQPGTFIRGLLRHTENAISGRLSTWHLHMWSITTQMKGVSHMLTAAVQPFSAQAMKQHQYPSTQSILCSCSHGLRLLHGRKHTLKAPPMPNQTGRCSLVCVHAKIQGIARRSSMLPAACKVTAGCF